jgi:exodeoxyribonuclease-3
VKIGTWNVNGLRKRAPEVVAWLAREQLDVACLQEIKCTAAQVPEAVRDSGYHAVWHGAGGYSGVALLVHADRYTAPAFFHPAFDHETRIACAEVGGVVLGSVYIPNGGKDYLAKMTFLRAIEAWVGEVTASGKPLVLCGDFNVARTDRDVHPMERKPIVGQTREERALIDALFAHGLVDVGRLVDPDNDRLFTWWAPWRNLRQRNIGWRLDYIAAHHSLVDASVACKSYREVGSSDHAPVIAHLLEP